MANDEAGVFLLAQECSHKSFLISYAIRVSSDQEKNCRWHRS